jgi:hypothetical protein
VKEPRLVANGFRVNNLARCRLLLGCEEDLRWIVSEVSQIIDCSNSANRKLEKW